MMIVWFKLELEMSIEFHIGIKGEFTKGWREMDNNLFFSVKHN